MQIVYNKYTGEIINHIADDIDIYIFFRHYSDEIKESLATIFINNLNLDLNKYKVVDEELVEKDIEIIEPEQIEPIPSNSELQKRIKELEVVIDTLIGGVDDGL